MRIIITIGLYLVGLSLFAQPTTEVRTYFDVWNTQIKAIEYITDMRQLHGELKYYYENGQIRNLKHYKLGKKEGLQITYFLSGKVNVSVNYLQDKHHGAMEEYRYEGEAYYLYGKTQYDHERVIWNKFYYSNGKLKEHTQRDGVCTIWYANGIKYLEFTKRNDLMEGTTNIWYEDGSNAATATYINGYQDGDWEYYGLSGKVIRTEQYDKGVRVGKWTYYYSGDIDNVSQIENLEEATHYILINYSNILPVENSDAVYHGAEIYTINNQKIWEGFIKQTGVSIEGSDFDKWIKVGHNIYYENGQKVAEGEMVGVGQKDGEWKYYENGQLYHVEKYKRGASLWSKSTEQLAQDKQEYQLTIKQADAIFDNQDFEQALQLYKKAINLTDDDYPRDRMKETQIKVGQYRKEVNRLNNEIRNNLGNYYDDKRAVENLYKVEDKIKSAAMGETIYKFKKAKLYNAQLLLRVDHESKFDKSGNVMEKHKLLRTLMKLNDRMKQLATMNTKDLEKLLKGESDLTRIIHLEKRRLLFDSLTL